MRLTPGAGSGVLSLKKRALKRKYRYEMKIESGNYFQQGINEYITRYNSGELYCLRSLDERFPVSNEDLNRITAICNEEQIYSFLFRDRLGGREYTVEDARSFMSLAKAAAKKTKPFSFSTGPPR
jgi:hypothetical protein